MKYLFVGLIILFPFGIFYYIVSGLTLGSDNWDITKQVRSPNKNALAIVRCNSNGGATVGFYCKLFINIDKKESEVMMIKTDEINIKWISINRLEASFEIGSKIYDFTNVYWDHKTKSEIFINLKEI